MNPASASIWIEINSLLLLRYLINILAVLVLIRGIYYPRYRRTDLFLTFFAFNSIIFLVSYLLNKVEMSTGAAFGLFAVFSILRYRTEGLSARDMTYLFLSIAIGLILAVSKGSPVEWGVFATVLILITFILEGNIFMKRESSKLINYDSLQHIRPEQEAELLNNLRLRTGLDIHRIEIGEIDYLKDCCKITLYYYEGPGVTGKSTGPGI